MYPGPLRLRMGRPGFRRPPLFLMFAAVCVVGAIAATRVIETQNRSQAEIAQ
ncbi:MAG: hypothetical protein JJE39_11015 [Vicinamibacteria bacterium]|nr:hypothetical protein [Vicinamibacteria bacterium]